LTLIFAITLPFVVFVLFGTPAPAAEPKTIYVGTQPDFPPFCYTNESGTPTGYDVELVRKIFAKLPEYKLEFQVSAWDGIFLGLESNKTQMIADNLTRNEERETKYYVSEPYYFIQMMIVVKKGRTDIKTLEDLYGKTLELVVGTAPALVIEKWNEERGNKIKLQYTKATTYTDPLQDVANGRVDAYLENAVNLAYVIKELDLDIEATGDPVYSVPVAFAYRRDALGLELRDKVDSVLAEFIADGTLRDLAVEWTGSDSSIPRKEK